MRYLLFALALIAGISAAVPVTYAGPNGEKNGHFGTNCGHVGKGC